MFNILKQVLQAILLIITTIGLLLISALSLMFDFADTPTWIVLAIGAVGIFMIFITLKD